jgi:RES domain-containing protein
MHEFDVSITGLLDLSSPAIRDQLGVSLDDLIRTGGSEVWKYELTHPIGAWAKAKRYKGLIAPSAQADGGVNVVLFDWPWLIP